MYKLDPITGALIDVGADGGGIGGTTGTTDNAIPRADGTGGSTLQAGGTNPPTYDDAGNLSAIALILPATGSASATTLQFAGAANTGIFQRAGRYIMFASGGSEIVYIYPGGLATGGSIGFSSGSLDTFGPDTFIVRDVDNTLALRNGANGQTWIVSRTFTDTSNYSQFKTIVTGSVVAFTVSELGTGVGTLTGYTFDKSVTAPNIPVVDTGWTANADGGDKTAVIGSTATLDGIATALNLVTAGAGTQLENIAQKVKALEAVLVALKLPNA